MNVGDETHQFPVSTFRFMNFVRLISLKLIHTRRVISHSSSLSRIFHPPAAWKCVTICVSLAGDSFRERGWIVCFSRRPSDAQGHRLNPPPSSMLCLDGAFYPSPFSLPSTTLLCLRFHQPRYFDCFPSSITLHHLANPRSIIDALYTAFGYWHSTMLLVVYRSSNYTISLVDLCTYFSLFNALNRILDRWTNPRRIGGVFFILRCRFV